MYWKVIENDQQFGIAELDIDGHILRANAKLAAILGVTPDQLTNVHVVDVVCEETRREMRSKLRASRRATYSWGMHLCLLSVSELEVWCQTTMIPVPKEAPTQAHHVLIACPLPQLDCSEEVSQLRKDLAVAKQQTIDLAMAYATNYPPTVEVKQIQQNSDSGVNQAGDNDASINDK